MYGTGTSEYGVVKYGQETTLSGDEIELYKPDLLSRLPPFMKNIQEFKAANNVMSYELGVLNWQVENVLNQCFLDTATWGLIFWETEYNIQTDLNKSYEDRREIIKAKLRGSGTVTKAMLKNVVEAFSGGEADIVQNYSDYSFIVRFIGIKGIPKNMQGLINMIEDIKPAHLGYSFKYTYTVWNFIKDKNLTINQARAKTWNDLKVYDG